MAEFYKVNTPKEAGIKYGIVAVASGVLVKVAPIGYKWVKGFFTSEKTEEKPVAKKKSA